MLPNLNLCTWLARPLYKFVLGRGDATTMMMIRELEADEEEEGDWTNTSIPTELVASGLQHRLNNLSD